MLIVGLTQAGRACRTHEPSCYKAAVAIVLGIQAALVLWFFKLSVWWALPIAGAVYMASSYVFPYPSGKSRLKTFLFIELILTMMLAQAAFKITYFYYRPTLAQYAFGWLSIILLLHKIFFIWIDRALHQAMAWLLVNGATKRWGIWPDIVFPLFLVLLVYVPDYEAALARMFLGEQFHHTNPFIMCSGWAHIAGSILNVDVISRYGMGVVIILSEIAHRFLGGFSYESMFLVVMWGVMLYYVLWYVLMRQWFGNVAWTVAGLLLAIKLQMFHTETFPFIYTYSNQTPIRCFWDVVTALVIYRHVITHQRRWLVLAGALCGLAIFYTTGDGLYLTLGFYGYLACHLLNAEARSYVFLKRRWGWRILGVYAALPFIVAALLFVAAVGRHFVTAQFWQNSGEFMKYYSSGFGSTPMASSWSAGNYWEFLVGAALPVLFAGTILVLVSLMSRGLLPYRFMFVVFIAFYAIGSFHYYAMLSNNTSYYRNGAAIAFLVMFWVWFFVRHWPLERLAKFQLALIGLCLYALVTHHNFIAFPNIFNVSSKPMIDPLVAEVPMGRSSYFNHLFISYPDRFKLPKNSLGETDEMLVTEKDFKSHQDLKEFYRREFDFTKDAKLISDLVPPQGKAALISSFETKILIQAKRKPFFYYFELVNARPRRMRIFVVTHFYTFDNLQRTIDQIESEKPEYIFMERIFLTKEIFQAYLHDSMDLVMLLNHVFKQYEFYKDGEYLAALKRKPNT